MRRFIITGAPGAGKTAIIRQLELDGFGVVEEAATDIIVAAHAQGTVEPWKHPSFIDAIAHLQTARQFRASYQPDDVQFTTVAWSVLRRWRSTWGTLFLPFLPANWSASETKRSTKAGSFSFATLASSNRPKHGGLALRMRCVSRKFTKRPIGTWASN
jgi:AAA domain